MTELSYETVASLLSYDPETGDFRWLKSCGKRKTEAGQIAGAVKKNGYRVIKFSQRPYRANRLAWLLMTGAWPRHLVDHKNGQRGDDRWQNLRAATPSQNSANGCLRRHNTSGFKGVTRRGKRWRAEIKSIDGRKFLGSFLTPEEAHAAYLDAAKVIFGDFARSA